MMIIVAIHDQLLVHCPIRSIRAGGLWWLSHQEFFHGIAKWVKEKMHRGGEDVQPDFDIFRLCRN